VGLDQVEDLLAGHLLSVGICPRAVGPTSRVCSLVISIISPAAG
jgi:hypothetical protein